MKELTLRDLVLKQASWWLQRRLLEELNRLERDAERYRTIRHKNREAIRRHRAKLKRLGLKRSS